MKTQFNSLLRLPTRLSRFMALLHKRGLHQLHVFPVSWRQSTPLIHKRGHSTTLLSRFMPLLHKRCHFYGECYRRLLIFWLLYHSSDRTPSASDKVRLRFAGFVVVVVLMNVISSLARIRAFLFLLNSLAAYTPQLVQAQTPHSYK